MKVRRYSLPLSLAVLLSYTPMASLPLLCRAGAVMLLSGCAIETIGDIEPPTQPGPPPTEYCPPCEDGYHPVIIDGVCECEEDSDG